MATKQFLSLEGLSTYDSLIKQYIGTEDAKSIKSITVVGNTVSFFKTADASGTASYTVNLPDVSGFMSKIASATGGMLVESLATGEVSETNISTSDILTKIDEATGDLVVVSNSDGTISESGISIDDVATWDDGVIRSGYFVLSGTNHEISESAYCSDDLSRMLSNIDTLQSDMSTAQSDISTLQSDMGTAQSDISDLQDAVSTLTDNFDTLDGEFETLDQSLSNVARSGESQDVTYDNTTSGLTATDVQGAIDEIVTGLGTAAAADVATTAIQEESTDDSLVSAAQVASFVATEIAGLEGAMHFRGVITRQTGETDAEAIARVITSPEAGDVVVMSDNAKEYIYDGTTWSEVGDETEFVKKTTTIAGVDLQDNITATELRTALNVENGAQANVIEGVKVNGSALTPDGNKAVNVTVAEGATNGTFAVNGTDVAVHGLGSAAYTASTAYEAAGSISTAIGALDADLDASGTAQHSGTFVVSGVTEVDGVITAVDSTEVEAAGAAATAKSEVIGASTDTASNLTIYGCKAYTDAATEAIATADITALFD